MFMCCCRTIGATVRCTEASGSIREQMTTISSETSLAAYLRSQLAAPRTLAASAAASAARRDGPKSHSSATTGPYSAEDMASRIARRVAQLGASDPDRKKKAFRIFLECLMLREWGDALQSDPQFEQLVARVQQQMQDDPQLAEMVDEAAAKLLAG